MRWRNGPAGYGRAGLLLHWSVAALIYGLFGLGLYMTGLGYYDPWYTRGPELHIALGLLLALLLLLRLAWRLSDPPPPLPGRPWERSVARWVHRALYLLPFIVVVSGYLIPTANGDPLWLFDWFSLPAPLASGGTLADRAGAVHLYLAWATVALSLLHATAALKHHLIDRDATLLRMFGRRSTNDIR